MAMSDSTTPSFVSRAVRVVRIVAWCFVLYMVVVIIAVGLPFPVKQWTRIRDVATFVSVDKLIVAVDTHGHWMPTGLIASGHLGPPSSIRMVTIEEDGSFDVRVFEGPDAYCLSTVFNESFVIDGELVLFDDGNKDHPRRRIVISRPNGVISPATGAELETLGIDLSASSDGEIRDRLASASADSGWSARPLLATDPDVTGGAFSRTSVQIVETPGYQTLSVSNADPDNAWEISPVAVDVETKSYRYHWEWFTSGPGEDVGARVRWARGLKVPRTFPDPSGSRRGLGCATDPRKRLLRGARTRRGRNPAGSMRAADDGRDAV